MNKWTPGPWEVANHSWAETSIHSESKIALRGINEHSPTRQHRNNLPILRQGGAGFAEQGDLVRALQEWEREKMNYALYRCKHCGKTVARRCHNPPKKWIKSHCSKTGKDTHIMLVVEDQGDMNMIEVEA